jgi:hypothetical protein
MYAATAIHRRWLWFVTFALEALEGTVTPDAGIRDLAHIPIRRSRMEQGPGIQSDKNLVVFIVSKAPAGFNPVNNSRQYVNEGEFHPVGNGVGLGNLPLTRTTTIAPECLLFRIVTAATAVSLTQHRTRLHRASRG